jgi:hypothetical protein
LRRAAKRLPDAPALIDPPNRECFTDGEPRRLSYAQADRMVSAIADRLRGIGLHTDAIVGVQTANTIDGVLMLLGIVRAGMIAMLLPPLWRQAEAVAALRRVGANALVVSGRIGGTDHFELAMNIAAEIFPVRYVCGFGRNPPDGIIPFDDLYDSARLDSVPAIEAERPDEPGAHLAVITWDQTAGGLVPVARSHAEVIAGGLATVLDRRIEQHAVTISTLTLSSFAALAVTVVPWLLFGSTLALHQPFDPETFRAQRKSLGCRTVIVPGPLVAQLAQSGHLSADDGLGNVVAVWRAPDRLCHTPAWRDASLGLIDVQVFGEIGLVAAARAPDGQPAAIPFGPVPVPGASKGTMAVIEIAATPADTVALRGAMVPRAPFPPGVERSHHPYFKIAPSGLVDTGYACRPNSDTMVVTGPPPGIVSVGGARFVVSELQELVGETGDGTLAVLPDALCGHRLAGNAADRAAVHAALERIGASPLLVGAFRERPRPTAQC